MAMLFILPIVMPIAMLLSAIRDELLASAIGIVMVVALCVL